MKPADLPDPTSHAHGTRARYVGAKCRCDACRKANCDYQKSREHAQKAGDWNGLVDAGLARAHLAALSKRGIGYKAAADAAGVARSVVGAVVGGGKRQIRARTAKAILAVKPGLDACFDGAIVPARETWQHVRWLRRQGLTKTEIAEAIGRQAKQPALQLGRRGVLARNARAIVELRERVAAGLEIEICASCGHSHETANRQRLIARMAREGIPAEEIIDAWPCFYGRGETGYRMLMRDLSALRHAPA